MNRRGSCKRRASSDAWGLMKVFLLISLSKMSNFVLRIYPQTDLRSPVAWERFFSETFQNASVEDHEQQLPGGGLPATHREPTRIETNRISMT